MTFLLGLCPLLLLGQLPEAEAKRWEPEIAKLEAKLKAHPIPADPVLFAGSSSIRLWDTAKAFPTIRSVNVGFGGSDIRHSTAFAERIILPVKPRAIVLYAGDNDIANKRTPEQVRQDFTAFVKTIHTRLPNTRIYFIAIKPSRKRWSQYEQQSQANKLVREYCESQPLLGYIDIVPGTLGEDGLPVVEQFVKDELHLSEKGYSLWQKLIAVELDKLSKP